MVIFKCYKLQIDSFFQSKEVLSMNTVWMYCFITNECWILSVFLLVFVFVFYGLICIMCFFFFSSQEWAHDWGWPTGLNEKPVSHTWVGILFRFIFISFAAGLFKKKYLPQFLKEAILRNELIENAKWTKSNKMNLSPLGLIHGAHPTYILLIRRTDKKWLTLNLVLVLVIYT